MKLRVTYINNGCKILADTFRNTVQGYKRADNLRRDLSAQGFITSIERKS